MKQSKKSGRGGGIRTHDHLVPNQVRYRAALRPEQSPNIIDQRGKGQAKTSSKVDCRRLKINKVLFFNEIIFTKSSRITSTL